MWKCRRFHLMRQFVAIFSSHAVLDSHLMGTPTSSSSSSSSFSSTLLRAATGDGKSMQNYRKLRYAICVMGTDDIRCLVRLSVQFGIVCDLASLEKGGKLLSQKDQPVPLFMLDCDAHRHAAPVHVNYLGQSALSPPAFASIS